jgi:hypothetical protein
MPIAKGVMTKEEEIKERDRLKGSGFEAPCYMHDEKKKKENKKQKPK